MGIIKKPKPVIDVVREVEVLTIKTKTSTGLKIIDPTLCSLYLLLIHDSRLWSKYSTLCFCW